MPLMLRKDSFFLVMIVAQVFGGRKIYRETESAMTNRPEIWETLNPSNTTEQSTIPYNSTESLMLDYFETAGNITLLDYFTGSNQTTDNALNNDTTEHTFGNEAFGFRISQKNGFLFQGPQLMQCPVGYSLGPAGVCERQ